MKRITHWFDNKVFRVVYGILKTILFLIIIIYLAFIIIQRLTNNTGIMGYRVFNIASASMTPVYNVGDVIVVKDCDVTTLRVGDDISYYGKEQDTKDKIITHRIVQIEEDESQKIFHTKGIANLAEDPIVEESQIYGKVERKLLIISTINRTIRNIYGFFFLIFVPLVLVIFLEIADTIVDYREDRRDRKNDG